MRTRPLAAISFLLLLLGGCSGAGEDPASTGVEVRDSAGVRIVESAAPAEPLGSWTVAPEPDLVLGALDGDEMLSFDYVFGAATLASGRVVIAQVSEPFLRWFDASGAFVRGVGRFGDGPGEFTRTFSNGLWLFPGDSLALWDHSPGRLTVIDSAGNPGRTTVAERPSSLGFTSLLDLSPRGLLSVVPGNYAERPVGEVFRPDQTYVVHHSDGSLRGAVGDWPGPTRQSMEFEFEGRAEPIRDVGLAPFGATSSAALDGERILYTPGHLPRIDVHGLDGTLEARFVMAVEPRPLTTEMRDAFVREWEARAASSTTRTRPAPADMEFPEFVPAAREVRVDRTGAIWLRAHPVPGDTLARWSVFESDGAWTTVVETPIEWQLFEIGAEHLLVRVEDDLGVQRVMRYRLTR